MRRRDGLALCGFELCGIDLCAAPQRVPLHAKDSVVMTVMPLHSKAANHDHIADCSLELTRFMRLRS